MGAGQEAAELMVTGEAMEMFSRGVGRCLWWLSISGSVSVHSARICSNGGDL